MSMSTHVVGFKPPDEKWKRMKAAYDACVAAGLGPPQEVWDFFNGEAPDEGGVVVPEEQLESCGAIREYSAESCGGYEILIDKLPEGVKVVRVYNSF